MVHRKNLPKTASVAQDEGKGRLNAPSAERNMQAILSLVKRFAPHRGWALEIASGTGQHIVSLAAAVPDLIWQPSDVDPSRLKSIKIWINEKKRDNVEPPILLDATETGWSKVNNQYDLIFVSNLLHLVSREEAEILITEISRALAPDGMAILYGPFKRQGELSSQGDIDFHQSIIEADPALGYKNDADILGLFAQRGLMHKQTENIPANNLSFVFQKN